MLSIKNIHFAYGNSSVLDKLSLELGSDKIHGILGPNGSGKTTLLDILAGRLSPDEGTVTWKGKPLRHRHIAYLESEPYFYPMITGREYLNLFALQNPDFNINRWSELFVLPLDRLIETYSSGMKKKLAFMGVICLDRPIMLLDEPFNNLDIETNSFVSKLLGLLAGKGKMILLSSHILEILSEMADEILVLEGGCIKEKVPKKDFKDWKETYQTEQTKTQIDKAQDLL